MNQKKAFLSKTLLLVLRGMLGGAFLSLFIVLYHFGLRSAWIFTLLAFAAIAYYLSSDRSYRFYLGFFTGVFWFYWIPFSFRFFGIEWFIPLAIIGIGLFYGILFYVSLYVHNLIYRTIFLFFLPFIAPFGFDWLNFRVMFAPSIFHVNIIGYALLLVSIFLALYCKGSKKLLSVLGIIFCLFLFPKNKIAPTSVPNIELVTTQIPQEQRWNLAFISENVSQNFRAIESAIDAGKDIVVLPETAFPFVLEKSPNILQSLQNLSHKIAIVAGSLRQDGNKMYNSSYIFTQGSFRFVDKQLLVPFGETMPLPPVLKNWLNEQLGKGEFSKPANFAPMDFEIGEWRFRSAICYEATSEKMFRGNPEFMIAISNNAWFTPSTQPALQELVMLAYAKAHYTIIYHATNGSTSAIINPFNLSHF